MWKRMYYHYKNLMPKKKDQLFPFLQSWKACLLQCSQEDSGLRINVHSRLAQDHQWVRNNK
jgi:hypothetical protein